MSDGRTHRSVRLVSRNNSLFLFVETVADLEVLEFATFTLCGISN